MCFFINNQQKLNDIIFEQRNKEYGAYAIRSEYGQIMLKSLFFMMLGFGCLVATAYYLNLKPNTAEIISGQIPNLIYTIPVDLKKEIKPEIPKTSEAVLKNSPNSLKTIVPSTLITDSVPTDAKIISETSTQFSTAVNDVPTIPGALGSGITASATTGGNGQITHSTTIKGPYEVDSPPEFEGGLAALYKFVASRLKYPESALEEGIQGTVFVKFVVDEKGKVGDLSVLNKPGFGFDEEALRVVSIIPNFKTPAKVNGEAVKVYYQLPIKFKCR